MRRQLSITSISGPILILISFLVLFNHVSAQDKASKIDELMQLYHDYGQFNGTVLVAEAGKVIFKNGYGYANMEWRIPNEPNTKCRIGSITKQFTSMLIMQLVEQGKIKLNDKITNYLPEYREDTGDRVTIHQLLIHTSGIPSYTNLPGFFEDISRDPYTVDEFIEKYCSGDLEFEPGSQFAYNNSGYFLLGAIIEKVTGKTYEAFLKEKILDPLNMNDTGYDHHETIISNRAGGYEKSFSGYKNTPFLDMSLPYAAGSLYSTVEDLYLWDQALYKTKLISKKLKKIMFTPYHSKYAYGWIVTKMPLSDSQDSLNVVAHGGGINGFVTLITRLVDDRHLIVLFNNTGATDLNRMSIGIVNILYDRPYDLPKKSIADALYETLTKKDITSAIKQYHELKEKYPDDYDFRLRELNRLGYELLRTDMVDNAIEIFKLNTEVYPKESNGFDSLGEAYMKKGERELAIINYAKSLELNPKNKNAIEKLKKMNE